jgi:hypothetical protein
MLLGGSREGLKKCFKTLERLERF